MTLQDEIRKSIEGQVRYYDLSSEEEKEVKNHLEKSFEALNEAIANKVKTTWKKAKIIRSTKDLIP